MRRIDHWVGKPVCWLLTQADRVARLIPRRKKAAPPARILFIKLEEQGALVVACPAIMRAIDLVGRDNVFFITFDQNAHILDMLNLLPPGNIFSIRSSNPWQVFIDTLRVIARVRRRRIDATVDMEFFARGSAALTYLCGSRVRVGLHAFSAGGPYRGDLMTHKVLYNPYLHTADAYEVLVMALTSDPRETPMLKAEVPATRRQPPTFTPPEASLVKVRGALEARFGNALPRPLFVFHPNTGDALRVRKWPKENYVALAETLMRRYPDGAILLTGLPSENEDIGWIAQQANSRRVHSLSGHLNLADLLTLLSMADLLVTNDSGPAHFSALTPVHLVALYGPETPTLFGPLGTRNRVLHHPVACSPCLTAFNYRLSSCGNNVCVKSITVEEIMAAVEACLAERRETT